MRLGTTARRLTCIPIALMFVLATSISASAASYDLQAQSYQGGGYGRVNGTLGFTSQKQFDYRAFVTDICPGDSQGVSFYFVVKYLNGNGFATTFRGKDQNGCTPAGQGGAEGPFDDNVNSSNNIDYASVVMCFTQGTDLCEHVGQVSLNKDNPYT